MATNPNDLENGDRGRSAEEAAALALLLAQRRYDLPQLIRQTGARPKPFRRIGATEALRARMAAPYFSLVRAWQAQRPALLAAYEQALGYGVTSTRSAFPGQSIRRVMGGRTTAAQRRAMRPAYFPTANAGKSRCGHDGSAVIAPCPPL